MSMEHSLKTISDATALIKDTVGASSFVSDLCDYIDKQFFTMCIAQQKYIKEIEEQREHLATLEKQRLLGVKAQDRNVLNKKIDYLEAQDRIYVLNKKIDYLEAQILFLTSHNEAAE